MEKPQQSVGDLWFCPELTKIERVRRISGTGSVQGQVGPGFEQPDLVENVLEAGGLD